MQIRTSSGRLTATVAMAAALAAALIASCAGAPRPARPAAASAAADASAGIDAAAAARDEVKAAIAEAMALSLAGKPEAAMDRVAAALGSARDRAALAGALEAKAWAMLFAGSREAALEALKESARAGAPYSPGRAVLEFRLAAQDNIAEARRRAAEVLSRPGAGDRAALAIAVMLGDKDLRDVAIESPEAAAEFATYLSGYSLPPAAPSAAPAVQADAVKSAGDASAAIVTAAAPPPPGGRPVIVVAEPESVGADEATVAVARLACRDALTRRGRFSVVDGDSRRAALDELEASLAAASAGDKDKAVGALFSADYVASGSVVSSGTGWLVAFSLSSAADGSIVASDFSMAADHAGIMSAASRFAATLDGLAPAGL